ncbi:MAG TPA: hypothetical protein VFQ87_16325, partial [Bradyrhizobium sp.]|nr:hypothetical protein [Bradyrhizobium sp.]
RLGEQRKILFDDSGREFYSLEFCEKSGSFRSRPENTVIARSEATKQSSLAEASGLLRFARNDEPQ